MNIAGEQLGVGFRFDQDALKTALEEMPHPLLSLVEIDGIGGIDKMHDLRKVAPGRFDHEMKMILHEAVGVEGGRIGLVGFPEAIQKAQ